MTTIHMVIADDEPRIGELLRRTFTAYLTSIRITVVADGEAALDLCSSQHVDLLLTDYLMPTMNGSDLARALRARGAQLLIVLMSGGNVDWAAVNMFGGLAARQTTRRNAACLPAGGTYHDRLALCRPR